MRKASIPCEVKDMNRKSAFTKLLLITSSIIIIAAIIGIRDQGTQSNPMITIGNGESMSEVVFEESSEYIVNPYMGAVAPAKYTRRIVDGTLVAASYSWADIESVKGVYDFTKAEQDNNFDYWVNQQQNQYMLHFAMDEPKLSDHIGYEQIDIPMWLYNELKQEALTSYRALLQEAENRGDSSAQINYRNSIDKIQNDREAIEEFNASNKEIEDIPGVGTFYRYTTDTINGPEIRGGFSPNYSSPLILKYHSNVLKAIAERYDNENTYAMVMGSLGHWGEMHTDYIKDKTASGRYPDKETAQRYEQAYADSFKNVLVSSRYPRQVAKNNNFGLHNHAFGSPKHTYSLFKEIYEKGYKDSYTGDTHPAMKDFWRTAPSGGEFLYTGDQRYLLDENIDATVQQAKDTHLTWFNEVWYGMDEETTGNMFYFYSKIGYRIAIESAEFTSLLKSGEAIKVESIWKNNGTAPFYKDAAIKAVLIAADGSKKAEAIIESNLKTLMPGIKKSYFTDLSTSGVEKGSYSLYVGIYEKDKEYPTIKLAVKNKDYDNMYFVGNITIR